jgi:hypothetical protein
VGGTGMVYPLLTSGLGLFDLYGGVGVCTGRLLFMAKG